MSSETDIGDEPIIENDTGSSDIPEIQTGMSLILIGPLENDSPSNTESNLIINYLPYEFTEVDLEVDFTCIIIL